MKRPEPHDNNYRRESVAAMAWLVLFAILVVGAVQQRFSAPTSVEVAQKVLGAS
jgi:hypothetical protein